MSIDLVELGQSIGEAQATAEAALETAQIAEAEATLAAVAESSNDASAEEEATDHCGPDCPCQQNQARLEAMLVALSDKYDDDMEVLQQVIDVLLGDQDEEEPGDGVETIDPEEEEDHGSEPTGDKPGTSGHTEAGSSSDGAASEAEAEPEPEHRHKHTAARRRVGFRRGRH